ncbi:MAG TPA: phosphoadenylyl-sulfate reductase [Chitinophagaceae bacterium]|nr:phosphoadenylyl-sulfate reductase [Chitinophagaceae bacterium]
MQDDLNGELESLDLPEALKRVAELFPGQVAFSSSFGQEDMVLTDTIFTQEIPIEIFTLDTGRLFQETYDLMDLTRARYGKYGRDFKIYFPDFHDVEQYVTTKGINAFYESVENRKSCCFIRKVKPLKRALEGQRVWVTGLRAEQSDNRKAIPIWEWDEAFGIYKFNPLIHWSYEEILQYLKTYSVPYNKLHDKGFISIGCAPCTRAIAPDEHPRAGRWWWEDSKKECGLHSQETPEKTNAQ